MTSFYTSSPTVVIPAQPIPDQYFHSAHFRNFQQPQPNGLFNQSPASNPRSFPPTPSSGCIAGRKRSRGDIFSPDDDQEDHSTSANVDSSSASRGEPMYGPGMTLIYPNDPRGHYTVDASSQSGTWVDSQQQADASPNRPIMPSRKSQRTNRSTDDVALFAQPDIAPRATTNEPLIDEATRLLGISWMRMDRYEGGRINQKAYTRWIERYYPGISSVELWFQNNSIPGYLGVATNNASGMKEYLLWSDDLKQAVLVTRQPTELVSKLSMAMPSTLISSATMSIFANTDPASEPSVTATPVPSFAAETVTPQVGDMEVD